MIDQEKSREKALAERAQKGLLSKADQVRSPATYQRLHKLIAQVRYAELVAKKESARRKGEDGKDGCVIA